MNKFQGSTGIHICGHTRDRWEEVIGTGVSGFWVDNCESLQELKECYGDKVAISGNVPPVDVLKNGTFEEIDQAIKKCIIEAGDNPRGYNLCPGCTTPIDTTKENHDCIYECSCKVMDVVQEKVVCQEVLQSYKQSC